MLKSTHQSAPAPPPLPDGWTEHRAPTGNPSPSLPLASSSSSLTLRVERQATSTTTMPPPTNRPTPAQSQPRLRPHSSPTRRQTPHFWPARLTAASPMRPGSTGRATATIHMAPRTRGHGRASAVRTRRIGPSRRSPSRAAGRGFSSTRSCGGASCTTRKRARACGSSRRM